MGNGLSSRPTGLERQHKYGNVEIDNEGNLAQGDMNADQIAAFFARSSPSEEMLERARLANDAKMLEGKSG